LEPLIHFVSLENVLRQPDELTAACGANGDWTTKRNLVTCQGCRELIGSSGPRARPCAGGEWLDPVGEP
jgi:hypothetical protein